MRQAQKQDQRQRLAIRARQKRDADEEREDLEEDIDIAEEGVEEGTGLEEGDEQAEERDPWDWEWRGELPLVRELPRAARPLVLYRIYSDYSVHRLSPRATVHSEIRDRVAHAVALHLKEHRVPIQDQLGWTESPAIRGENELLKLITRAAGDDMALQDQYKVMQGLHKDFSIRLPSAEIVAIRALMTDGGRPAQLGKTATRAAALRRMSERPSQLAQEQWTDQNWDRFEKTQNKKAR